MHLSFLPLFTMSRWVGPLSCHGFWFFAQLLSAFIHYLMWKAFRFFRSSFIWRTSKFYPVVSSSTFIWGARSVSLKLDSCQCVHQARNMAMQYKDAARCHGLRASFVKFVIFASIYIFLYFFHLFYLFSSCDALWCILVCGSGILFSHHLVGSQTLHWWWQHVTFGLLFILSWAPCAVDMTVNFELLEHLGARNFPFSVLF